LWGESNAYAHCNGYGNANSNRDGDSDTDANFNAVAESYSDAKACADPAAAPDSVALSESVKAGTREGIREFLRRAISLLRNFRTQRFGVRQCPAAFRANADLKESRSKVERVVPRHAVAVRRRLNALAKVMRPCRLIYLRLRRFLCHRLREKPIHL
jgi:hypothetical protein